MRKSPLSQITDYFERPEVCRVMGSMFDANFDITRSGRIVFRPGPTKEQKDAALALKISNIRYFHESRLHAIQSLNPRLPQ